MKLTKLIYAACCILFVYGAGAQYYKTTKRNVLFLNTNTLFPDKNSQFFSTIEGGKEIKRWYVHGGAGIHYFVNSFNRSLSDSSSSRFRPAPFYSVGGDVKIVSYGILNLSKKSYCKVLGGAIRAGADINKKIKSAYNKDYGYRLKIYFEFYISRSGSNKYDIGWHKAVQLGYAFSSLAGLCNPHHSIMLNFLIIKHHIYKFAEWY